MNGHVGFAIQRRLFWKTLEKLRTYQGNDFKLYPDMFGNGTYQIDVSRDKQILESWHGALE
jgi:hypothetical protein